MKNFLILLIIIFYNYDLKALNVAFYTESPKEQQIIERCFSVSSITYIQTKNPQETIDMVYRGVADVGIGNITINRRRADLVDFSYPHTSVETRVLVKSSSGFIGFIKNNTKAILYLCLFLLICSITIWYTEQNSQAISDDPKGIIESLYFCFITITTIGYGDKVVKKPLSKILVCVMAVMGIGFFASSVSQITNTVYIKQNIDNIEDLQNYEVATYSGTYTASLLQKNNVEYITIERDKEPNFKDYVVFVYDAPVVEKFQKQNDNLNILPVSLGRQYYGIVVDKQKPEILQCINNLIIDSY